MSHLRHGGLALPSFSQALLLQHHHAPLSGTFISPFMRIWRPIEATKKGTPLRGKLFPEAVEVISVYSMEDISIIYAKGLETGEIHEKMWIGTWL